MKGSRPTKVSGGQTAKVSIPLDPNAGSVARVFTVHFTSNKSFIEPYMRQVLKRAIDFASDKDNKDDKLVIVGHTDKVDTDEFNQSLSERRARSVYAYLTFGRARAASLREWKELRQTRPKGEVKTVKDSWGLRESQHMLQDLGHYPGNVDGKPGPLTDSAVRAFRCKAGLPPGQDLDDPTLDALIEAYMAQDGFAVPASRFLPNCSAEDVIKWLGCGERDPVKNVATAWRPNRRVELLFVKASKLPCDVPPPDTLDLVQDGAGSAQWCLPKGPPANRCCFVFPALPKKDAKPGKDQWVRQPAEPGTLDVIGTILRQARLKDGTTVLNEDGTVKLEPVPGGQPFFLIAADGEILAAENTATGEPIPTRTGAGGKFSFKGKKAGTFHLAALGSVLARLAEDSDAAVKGNAVCKRLTEGGKLDVVLINAPVLREIRLPVTVHLLTGLNSNTREPRSCSSPGGGEPFRQKTAQTVESIAKLFEGDGAARQGANFVWRQARIRFDPIDVIEAVYQNPSRPSCLVDNAEMGAFFNLCSYPNTINVFFVAGFDDPQGRGEAGGAVSPESAASQGLREGGCVVGDRAVSTFDGLLVTNILGFEQQVEVLAHELGHFLNLEHVDDLPANNDRLMLPGTLLGKNRRLTQDEVDLARASKGARLACVPLTLRVTGAVRMGGARSNQFLFVRPLTPGATPPVTVDAVVSDALLAAGTVTMTGGQPGANDRQRLVSTATATLTEVTATYTPASGGDAVTARVVIHVANFTLRVEGNDARPSQPGSTTFITTREPGKSIIVVAQVDPGPFCTPRTLVEWTNGMEQADPLRRAVPRDPVASTRVTAKIGDQTRSLNIVVVETALATSKAPFAQAFQRLDIRGVLNSDRTSFDLSDLFDDQPDLLFRARADVPDVQGQPAGTKLTGKLTSLAPDGTVIETLDVTLDGRTGDRFVSLPVLAIPAAIPRTEIQLKAPQSLEVLRCRAEGKVRFTVDGLAGVGAIELPVQGRVAELCSVTIKGATTHPDRDVAAAQRVWAQLGIEVRVLNPRTIDQSTLLHIDSPSKQPDPDEIALFALGRDTCTANIIGYYVKSTSPAALGRTTHVANRPGFYATDDASQYTFGHELGHVLGLGHDPGSKNLMFEEGTSSLPDKARDVLLTQPQLSTVLTGGFLTTKP